VKVEDMHAYAPKDLLIVTTGSQVSFLRFSKDRLFSSTTDREQIYGIWPNICYCVRQNHVLPWTLHLTEVVMLSNWQRKTLCCIQLRCVTKFCGHLPFDLLKHVCCTLEIRDTYNTGHGTWGTVPVPMQRRIRHF